MMILLNCEKSPWRIFSVGTLASLKNPSGILCSIHAA